MKHIRIISALLIAGLFFAVSCNKDKYTNGAATITGTVTYKIAGATATSPAPNAEVNINYNSSTLKTPYDQTIVADANGKFTVKLPTGNYFFSATYTDANGLVYNTVQGVAANINNTNDQVSNVNIVVQ